MGTLPLFGLSESDIAKMAAKRDVKGLLKALAYKDLFVRWRAAEALGKIGDKLAVDGLIVALKDQHKAVRGSAAYALGEIGDKRAADGLVVALKDQEPTVRQRAVDALVKIGDERLMDGLIAALKDQDLTVRTYAADALVKIGCKHKIEGLLAQLQTGTSFERLNAVEALAKTSDPRAMDGLAVALNDPLLNIRIRAKNKLIFMEGDRAKELVAIYERDRGFADRQELEENQRSAEIAFARARGGVPVLDLRSEKEKTIANHAMSPLQKENEEIAHKLAQLSRLSRVQYDSDKSAYEKTVAEFRRIGEQLCINGGDERMKLIAYRVQALGGKSRDCEMYWDGICGWQR